MNKRNNFMIKKRFMFQVKAIEGIGGSDELGWWSNPWDSLSICLIVKFKVRVFFLNFLKNKFKFNVNDFAKNKSGLADYEWTLRDSFGSIVGIFFKPT